MVDRLDLDEDEATPPCDLANHSCASTIQVDASHDIKLSSVHVYLGKGYVIRVWDTGGFSLVRSSISNAGIIGFYAGHFKFGPSANLIIANSVIARSRTNAIALQGVVSKDPHNPVPITGNVLNQNHGHGLWPVADIEGNDYAKAKAPRFPALCVRCVPDRWRPISSRAVELRFSSTGSSPGSCP